MNEAQKILERIKELTFKGEYDEAIKLTHQLPYQIGLKAHLLVIEHEHLNSKKQQ